MSGSCCSGRLGKERIVPHTVEGCRTRDEAMVCCVGVANRSELYDEPLFGESGGPKLIVSMSFGTSALFRRVAKF